MNRQCTGGDEVPVAELKVLFSFNRHDLSHGPLDKGLGLKSPLFECACSGMPPACGAEFSQHVGVALDDFRI